MRMPEKDAATGSKESQRDFDFTLYSHKGGPNGWKVAIVLSELGLRYRTIFTDFKQGDHRKEQFIKVCPNGRIPAIIDHINDDFAVWESGAILLYLAANYDHQHRLWPTDPKLQSQITSWLMLQVSAHSVIQGQAFWFKYFHTEHVPSATKRYIDESRRIYGVLDVRLSEAREALWDRAEALDLQVDELKNSDVWLVGESCSIADLSYLTWTRTAHRLDIDLEAEFPEVHSWMQAMMRRELVLEGLREEATQ